MRNRLPLMMIAVVALGFSAAGLVQAQEPTNNNSKGGDSTAKPCVVVYGAVRSPARVELHRPVRLAELIAVAGGANERAGKTVQITQAESGWKCDDTSAALIDVSKTTSPPDRVYILSALQSDDDKANPYLKHGDLVMVSELPQVYVMGQVLKPQAVPHGEQLTLMRAVAMAGGALSRADTRKVSVIRSTPGSSTRTEIKVDLKAIMKHQAEDLLLQPHDIIEVDPRGHGSGRFGSILLDTRQFPLRVVGDAKETTLVLTPRFTSQTSPPACCQFVVYGAVRAPSRFEAHRKVRLLEVLTLAGGTTDKAGGTVQVIHTNAGGAGGISAGNNSEGPGFVFEIYNLAAVLRADEKSNPYIEAGDVVLVVELAAIYVTGSVMRPQGIYPREPITLTRAIALVGGVTEFSKTDRIKIYRQSVESNARTEITVDLKPIMRHRAVDPVLQPYDIVEVPDKYPHPVHMPGNTIFDSPIFRDLPLRLIREDAGFLDLHL